MESAENGFKRHQFIPFSQNIPGGGGGGVAASLTSREEKLSNTILSLKKKIRFIIKFMYLPH